MKYSIIIPYYNQIKMTQMCLDSIRENTTDYELILVDNGSTEGVIELNPAEGRVIHNKKNEGFPVAINQGVEASTGDFICLLNNDVMVSPQWLDRLLFHLQKDLDVVGPITNYISGPQMYRATYYEDYEGMKKVADDIYKRFHQTSCRLYRLVGFCMVMSRSTWDTVGPFDPVYSPGNFEDDDFCLRAIRAGKSIGYARDVFVHHIGTVTHDELKLDYNTLIRKNKAVFDLRWNKEDIKNLIAINGG